MNRGPRRCPGPKPRTATRRGLAITKILESRSPEGEPDPLSLRSRLRRAGGVGHFYGLRATRARPSRDISKAISMARGVSRRTRRPACMAQSAPGGSRTVEAATTTSRRCASATDLDVEMNRTEGRAMSQRVSGRGTAHGARRADRPQPAHGSPSPATAGSPTAATPAAP